MVTNDVDYAHCFTQVHRRGLEINCIMLNDTGYNSECFILQWLHIIRPIFVTTNVHSKRFRRAFNLKTGNFCWQVVDARAQQCAILIAPARPVDWQPRCNSCCFSWICDPVKRLFNSIVTEHSNNSRWRQVYHKGPFWTSWKRRLDKPGKKWKDTKTNAKSSANGCRWKLCVEKK